MKNKKIKNAYSDDMAHNKAVAIQAEIESEIQYKKDKEIINSLAIVDLSPIATPEQEELIKKLYEDNPFLKRESDENREKRFFIQKVTDLETGREIFDPEEAWIQTYSGMRINPTKPNEASINLQDIAHALARQCRFSGHVKDYYSVAQHSVLVSHLCDSKDALAGLLHDASEAYLVDIPAPLKRSGKFDAYLEFEKAMQDVICKKFSLLEAEPESVKKADKLILATEARDMLLKKRSDWIYPFEPLPFTILPMMPKEAEACFIARFFELAGTPTLHTEYISKYMI